MLSVLSVQGDQTGGIFGDAAGAIFNAELSEAERSPAPAALQGRQAAILRSCAEHIGRHGWDASLAEALRCLEWPKLKKLGVRYRARPHPDNGGAGLLTLQLPRWRREYVRGQVPQLIPNVAHGFIYDVEPR